MMAVVSIYLRYRLENLGESVCAAEAKKDWMN